MENRLAAGIAKYYRFRIVKRERRVDRDDNKKVEQIHLRSSQPQGRHNHHKADSPHPPAMVLPFELRILVNEIKNRVGYDQGAPYDRQNDHIFKRHLYPLS
ncbi:MAG: hypothetical protein NTW64_01315 [Candidatus Omnitrophica bacterium]|nr:hypothetical protein [Candidatus Omnitrophota bacterium]